MQTFLPYPNFELSAACLDRQRLGKQRVEVLQLLKVLHGESDGWVNHPATKMWRGYEEALVVYGLAVCSEWISWGYKDTCYEKINAYSDCGEVVMPPWFNDSDFHQSHQSNLVRKHPDWYRLFFPDVADDIEYVWPV